MSSVPEVSEPKIDGGNMILDMKSLIIQKTTGLPEKPEKVESLPSQSEVSEKRNSNSESQ
jgi:hypothetical protein